MNVIKMNSRRPAGSGTTAPASLQGVLKDFSIEVMPRTAAKVEDFRDLLPAETRVYIAHIDGTPISEMVATAKRLNADGFRVMPHFPARSIKDAATLENWIKQYQDEANVTEALVLAGGIKEPSGDFHSSMQLMETGLFDKYGFRHLHVAGHPEGNSDIDQDGTTAVVDQALLWKQDFSKKTDAEMAIATQFAFDAKPIADWAEHLEDIGITMPIHVGVAGPAKLQTMIKFAMACGVGPSLQVLKKRAKDLSKLLLPFEPTEVLRDLATYRQDNPNSLIRGTHLFPLGGIKTCANWVQESGQSIVAQSARR